MRRAGQPQSWTTCRSRVRITRPSRRARWTSASSVLSFSKATSWPNSRSQVANRPTIASAINLGVAFPIGVAEVEVGGDVIAHDLLEFGDLREAALFDPRPKHLADRPHLVDPAGARD